MRERPSPRAATRLLTILSVLPVLLLTACTRGPSRPAVERIAILRFEDLGVDPAADWMGRGFSEVLAAQLARAPGINVIPAGRIHAFEAKRRPTSAPGISTERVDAIQSGATEIVYGQYSASNGVVRASMTLEDLLSRKVTSLEPVSAPDVFAAAAALARQISPRAIPFGTQNPQVLHTYINAFDGLAPDDIATQLQSAIDADPNFGPVYRQLALLKAQQRDVDGAVKLLNQALAHGNAMGDAERARIQLQSAVLRNDVPARLQALLAVAKSDPDDAPNWRDLASSAFAMHQYPLAVDAFRKELALRPDDVEGWNQLGYAAAYTGDDATASNALDTYLKIQPTSPNPLDSKGDAKLILGRLAEAESIYLQAAKKTSQFYGGLDFLKAAFAHLMTGDTPGADTLVKQYFDVRVAGNDALLEYRQAQWQWIAGRRKQAVQQMETVARSADTPAGREVAAQAYAQLALWNVMLGDASATAKAVEKAVSLATPTSGTPALLARFLALPPASVSEWTTRAQQLAPNPAQAPVRNYALAMALLLSKQFAAAVPVLQQIYDTGASTADTGIPVLLAWAQLESGHVPEAAALLRPNQPLADVGLTWATPFYFPRIYYLRGLAAEKQGKSDEAKENYKLFHTLSGPDPLMWGEEQRAK